MQATGKDTGYDVAHVAAGLVFVALISLVVLNRITGNASLALKVGH